MIPVFLLLTALSSTSGTGTPTSASSRTAPTRPRSRQASSTRATGRRASRRATPPCGRRRRRDRRRGAPVRRRPRGRRLRTGTLPATLRNTEIANQANLDVVINSNDPDYTDDTDYTDGGGYAAAGNPCYITRTGDDISAAGPLDGRARQGARPPVALRPRRAPALAERRTGAGRDPPRDQRPRFLPLAVPNNVITKVQVRYYNECIVAHTPLAKSDLAPLPTAPQQAIVPGVGTLWGIRQTAAVGRPARASRSTLPTFDASAAAGLPPDRGRGPDREPRRDQLRDEHLRAAPRDAVRRLLHRSPRSASGTTALGNEPRYRRRPPDGRLRGAPATRTSGRCRSPRPTALRREV